jgi:hypothetical protein
MTPGLPLQGPDVSFACRLETATGVAPLLVANQTDFDPVLPALARLLQ